METELQQETDLSQVKQLTFTGWEQLNDKSFLAKDQATGIEAIMVPNKKAWQINLVFKGQVLANLKEKGLEESKVYEVPQKYTKGITSIKTAHAVAEARAKDKLGIAMDGYIYRYTTNGNLYRLFTGTTVKGTTLLPKLQYFTIYARLNKTPAASLIVNLELKTNTNQDQDFRGPDMSMDEIDKYLASNPHLVGS